MKLLLSLLLVAAGCYGAHRDRGDDVGADGGIDPIDAPTCGSTTCDDVPAPTCADADTLRTYAATCEGNACAYPPTDVECGASGCCGDHCCGFTPSNEPEFGAVEPTGLEVAPPNGTFDTSTECTAASALGRCEVVARAGLGEACVCRADRIAIGDLRVTGERALVLLVHREVLVTGTLDVGGRVGVDGPGSSYVYTTPISSQNAGGVGGSHASRGGGASSAASAATYGDPSLIPLAGGMRGQPSGGVGGGGGGALQISARERIQVTGTINAGGGGGGYGASSFATAGAGGGGAGGAILLEAQTVIVGGKLLANGGGGGGAGGETRSGQNGTSAGHTTDPAAIAYGGSGDSGGGCALQGYTSGGYGGAGARLPDAAGSGGPADQVSGCLDFAFVGGGGGGGGVGRIRINTKTGCQCGGTIAPNASFGTVVTQ